MVRPELHDLRTDKRALEVSGLVESLAAGGRRVVVWVADEGRRQILDDFLWTFSQLAFVPHILWQSSLGEVDDPVVLVGEASNPNGATVLVIGDDPPPETWARGFDEIHDFIPPGPAGEERRSWWQRWAARADEG
jgi:DNA polymerase IIIc chi subunit